MEDDYMEIIAWIIIILSVLAGIIKLSGAFEGCSNEYPVVGGVAAACGVGIFILFVLLHNSIMDNMLFAAILEVIGIICLSLIPLIFAKISGLTGARCYYFIYYRVACGIGVALAIAYLFNSFSEKKRREPPIK